MSLEGGGRREARGEGPPGDRREGQEGACLVGRDKVIVGLAKMCNARIGKTMRLALHFVGITRAEPLGTTMTRSWFGKIV